MRCKTFLGPGRLRHMIFWYYGYSLIRSTHLINYVFLFLQVHWFLGNNNKATVLICLYICSILRNFFTKYLIVIPGDTTEASQFRLSHGDSEMGAGGANIHLTIFSWRKSTLGIGFLFSLGNPPPPPHRSHDSPSRSDAAWAVDNYHFYWFTQIYLALPSYLFALYIFHWHEAAVVNNVLGLL